MLTGVILFLTAVLGIVLLFIFKGHEIVTLFHHKEQAATKDLCAELQATADVVITQIEQRTAYLEELLDQADRTIAELRTLQTQKNVFSPSQPRISSSNEAEGETELLDAKQKQVLEFLRQGQDITKIAQHTGMGVGEIQLISRLYKH